MQVLRSVKVLYILHRLFWSNGIIFSIKIFDPYYFVRSLGQYIFATVPTFSNTICGRNFLQFILAILTLASSSFACVHFSSIWIWSLWLINQHHFQPACWIVMVRRLWHERYISEILFWFICVSCFL